MTNVQKISFVDSGQDFTEFYVRDGVVIDCQPFQATIWVGFKVVQAAEVGQYLQLENRTNGRKLCLQHVVEAVEDLPAAEADETVKVAQEWARRLQIDPAALGL